MINWLILFFKIFELTVSVALGELKKHRGQHAYYFYIFWTMYSPVLLNQPDI